MCMYLWSDGIIGVTSGYDRRGSKCEGCHVIGRGRERERGARALLPITQGFDYSSIHLFVQDFLVIVVLLHVPLLLTFSSSARVRRVEEISRPTCFVNVLHRIVKDGLDGAHASKLYVTSVYWTVTTLSTVGYGDIFASTIAERTYCILVSLGSSGWRGPACTTALTDCGSYLKNNCGVLFRRKERKIIAYLRHRTEHN